MLVEELVKILRKDNRYKKWSAKQLGHKFNVSPIIVRQARLLLKGDITAEVVLEPSPIKRESALRTTAEILISQGKIQEAIDVLSGLQVEKKKPAYTPSSFRKGNYIVAGCVHLPFHNKKAWKALCDIVRDTENLQGVILAGDILDMHSISRHGKGKIRLPGYNLEREYQEANKALDMLDDAIGERKITKEYFYGNHEDWYNQWGSDIDNSYIPVGSPYEACFKHRGYNVQFNWKVATVQLGDLSIMHGEWCNKHAAHKHAATLHKNVLFYHTHRMGSYMESNIAGYNGGNMIDKKSKVFNYMSSFQKDDWRTGFNVVHLDEDNVTHITQLDFKDDKFFYNNKIYR